MSVVAFLRRLLDAGMPLDTAMTAAEAFEAMTERSGAAYRPAHDPTVAVGLYVIADVSAGCVKVGVSAYPNGRLAALQTACPRTLTLEHFHEGGYDRARALEVERGAHHYLGAQRGLGEWFACSVEEAVAAIERSAAQ